VFGPLAHIAPPRAPEDGIHADYIGLRRNGGVVPIAAHDLRIDRAFPDGIARGTVALAGYGGGFHAMQDTAGNSGSRKATVHVIYAPYQFDANGVPTKAHAITIDTTPGNVSLQLVHGDGYFFSAKEGTGWTMAVDGSTALAMTPGPGPGVAGKITISGNLVVGAGATLGNPNTALPAAIAPKLAAYITQLEADIATALTGVGVGAGANGPAAAALFTGSAAPRAALVALIPAPNTTIA
jgi:hypothetical protein